jgi:hypothetical protein
MCTEIQLQKLEKRKLRIFMRMFITVAIILWVISSSLRATPDESPYGVGVIWHVSAAEATGSDGDRDMDYERCLPLDLHETIGGVNHSLARSEYEACLASGMLSAYSYAQGGPYEDNPEEPGELDIHAHAQTAAKFWDTLYFSRDDGREVYGTLTIGYKLMYDLLEDTQYGRQQARYGLKLVSSNDEGEQASEKIEVILQPGTSDSNDVTRTLTVPIRGPGAQAKFTANLGYGYPVEAGVGYSYDYTTQAHSNVSFEWTCASLSSSGIHFTSASGIDHRCWRSALVWPPQQIDPGWWIEFEANGTESYGTWLYPLVDPAGYRISDYCGGDWKNHGQFISCVAQVAEEWLDLDFITEEEKDTIVSGAARSDVGKKDQFSKGTKKK